MQRPEAKSRAELMVGGLSAGGNWIRTLGPRVRASIFETAAEPGDDEPAGSQSRILTIDKGRFTVRRARLAPAMISTPGHRASRRCQRGAASLVAKCFLRAEQRCSGSQHAHNLR